MQDLHCRVSAGLWQALHARASASGDSIRHIVNAALADYLAVEHRTLFQISTSTALVQGAHQGDPTKELDFAERDHQRKPTRRNT